MARVTRSGVIDTRSGCYECHPEGAHWWGKNAIAVAARHHDKTGHRTWAEQTTSIHYGSSEPPSGTV